MLVDGISLVEGSAFSNLVVDSGSAFPSSPDIGELFYKTSATAGLYTYDGATWVTAGGGGGGGPFTITGDVTGTIDGGTDALTLATVNSNVGSFGSSSSVPAITVNAKGLVTGVSSTNIQIAESQITDGSLLARVGGNEIISGTWTFNNVVAGQDPTVSTHLATKQYVDSVASGLNTKNSVRAATTVNITLATTQSIDGVNVQVGNRVLVKNQTSAATNGIYVVSAGAWTRSADFDGTPAAEVSSGAYTFVTEGTTQAATGWVLTTSDPITIGTTPQSWSQFSAAGGPAAAGTLTGTTLASNVLTSSLTSVGTITSGTWSGSFGAVSGANLTSLNASNLSTGTVGTARLGTGTADSTTFLRGDGSWQVVDSLPSQTGNSGKYLTTNGTVASWATVAGGGANLPRYTSISSAVVGGRVAVSTSQTITATTWAGGGSIAVGDVYSVYNDSGSPITLTAGGGLTMYKDGTATAVGSVTLAARGSCTVWYNTVAEVVVGGSVT